MNCFSCGGAIELRPGDRIGFRDDCSACGSDLHVCRNCALHDPSAHNQCREANAEWVGDRERANHCDYFTPGEQQGGERAAESARAKSALDGLFKK